MKIIDSSYYSQIPVLMGLNFGAIGYPQLQNIKPDAITCVLTLMTVSLAGVVQ
jgi:hypothetical protein